MNISAFSHSKYRNNQHSGDDAMLIIPGKIIAILDGATDPYTAQESSGRYASHSIGEICARLFSDKRMMESSSESILRAISSHFAQQLKRKSFVYGPSTTLSLAFFMDQQVRVINIGDSGIRVNGTDVYCYHKPVDAITTTARVAIYQCLKKTISEHDSLEQITREISFHGLERGLKCQFINKHDVENILADVLNQHGQPAIHQDIEQFILKGIISQKVYANREGHPLGFSTLNGNVPLMDDVIEATLNLEEVKTLEFFTDGYLTLPNGTKAQDWEKEHARVEKIDLAKVSSFKNIKGSTSTEFFDDRSVISVEMPMH
ncbi:protein phosphatase 2C domain-containing protein [Vibrio sp. S9_S30]|uniref:protein phosphatase 2C domain-containing protein n=1 Tax=Vibrio sp. S9_S30 TaxID=2720226 RepID=UPI001680FFA3|nr:protein phosphatase 2C domain-containing protein [Vibrio sp. S9_S30]MBD1556312.1 protein phosphatase 2C domain-containing protein [Vibrio sp. S9_S30]